MPLRASASYPGFFDEPFPTLAASWAVDLAARAAREARYDQRENAPVPGEHATTWYWVFASSA